MIGGEICIIGYIPFVSFGLYDDLNFTYSVNGSDSSRVAEDGGHGWIHYVGFNPLGYLVICAPILREVLCWGWEMHRDVCEAAGYCLDPGCLLLTEWLHSFRHACTDQNNIALAQMSDSSDRTMPGHCIIRCAPAMCTLAVSGSLI